MLTLENEWLLHIMNHVNKVCRKRVLISNPNIIALEVILPMNHSLYPAYQVIVAADMIWFVQEDMRTQGSNQCRQFE